MDFVTVHDQDGVMLAVLDNADRVSVTRRRNDLWTASFALPGADPANEACAMHNIVRIDGDLFRIVSMTNDDVSGIGGRCTYQAEHVLATLLDDVLFGIHEVGGPGTDITQVLFYILNRQTTQRWELQACEFDYEYAYVFQNMTLMQALRAVTDVFQDEFEWAFDTSITPWQLSLKRASTEAECGIHYLRNMTGIEKSVDAQALITRLYPLGNGTGADQLTIDALVPYIDADTIGTWGIKCGIWADTTISDAWVLEQRGKRVLNRIKDPVISYTSKAIDLYRITGQSWDRIEVGRMVRVTDDEHGIRFDARVVQVEKPDIYGDAGNIVVTISNHDQDTTDILSALAEKTNASMVRMP